MAVDPWCRIGYYNPDGSMIMDFKMTKCPPPAYRSEHEMRVVMREAIPRYLLQELPPGTIRYGSNVIDVTADATGKPLVAFLPLMYNVRDQTSSINLPCIDWTEFALT